MRLAPIDLVNKRFTRSRSGYAITEVEDYLREVASDYEHLLSSSAQMQERLENLERELERYQNIESMLKDALIVAQIAANETRELSKREADAIVREAQSRADRLLEEAVRHTEEMRQQRLRTVFEYRGMLRAALDGVEAEVSRIAPPGSAGPASDHASDGLKAKTAPSADPTIEQSSPAADPVTEVTEPSPNVNLSAKPPSAILTSPDGGG